ncbi:MAG TPA: heat-inducible transcriptional repressor HrcA [Sphingomonadales bacterium]|nr:heat-inducible transcriptional repressor HrcA [Sphingomonadales bacterium]
MSEDFSERQAAIFRLIVETYLDTGEPVGSRTLAKGGISLSPASIRSVMADLEEAGLLFAPHTSAGRLPTERGLRLFVDGLLEIGNLTAGERKKIEAECRAKSAGFEAVLEQATALLSGLSHCAGVVSVPKQNAPLKHMEFLDLGGGRGLAILVFQSGLVENRVIGVPAGLPPAALLRAANYLNARIEGKTLDELRAAVERELKEEKAELDQLTQKVVAAGLARRGGAAEERETLIVRGQAHLLEALDAAGDLERIRKLFEDLEKKQDFLKLLETAKQGEGVRIFIGAENKLFSLSGSSVIVSPYRNEAGKMVGAIGVIGPTRINYARIIPLVDYTARVVSRLI